MTAAHPPAAPAQGASELDCVVRLVAESQHVIPLKRGEKTPLYRDWKRRRICHKGEIDAYAGTYLNFGLVTGGGVMALDVDNKKGQRGSDELIRLELEGFDLPPTRTHRTPTGGFHYIFTTPTPVKNSVSKIAPGIDVRGEGGYIVLPGSRTNDGQWIVVDDSPIAEAPAWLVERCGAPRKRDKTAAKPAAKVDAQRAQQRAIAYLCDEAPLAVEGKAGDQNTFKVAARVKDFGLSEVAAVEVLAEHWNPRCSPPWTAEGLAEKVRNAYAYGIDQPGAAAPEADFGKVPPANVAPFVPQWVSEMNERYSVTNHAGRMMVHELVHDLALEYLQNEWVHFDDLKRRHLHEKVKVVQPSGAVRPVDKGAAWLDHAARRQYKAEAFLPGSEAPPDVLNLWSGFAIEPKPGRWPLFRAHIRDIICDGDETADAYVMNWLARCVQRPAEAGQVAIVLRGGEGAGKGTLADALLRVFGQHGKHISNSRHLVGNFNRHLAEKVFIFSDEATFAGNPEHRNVLFALITEPTFQQESKGVDVRTVKNTLHILMSSNANWVVPAGADARRFAVFNVNEKHLQDVQYFERIRRELYSGGLAAMLHDILARDITAFNVFDLPNTTALMEQKILTLKGPEAWLHGCLQAGHLGILEWTDRGLQVRKDEAHSVYRQVSKSHREFAPSDIGSWAKALKTVLGPDSFDGSFRPGAGHDRRRCLRLGGLTECRRAFERFLRCKIEWETDALDEPTSLT
jgi:hypothetical protein